MITTSVAQCTRERRQTTQELDGGVHASIGQVGEQSQGTLCGTSLLVCMHAACLPAYLLLEYVLLTQARPTMSCITLVYSTGILERGYPDVAEKLIRHEARRSRVPYQALRPHPSSAALSGDNRAPKQSPIKTMGRNQPQFYIFQPRKM